jgi:hypothetical protein
MATNRRAVKHIFEHVQTERGVAGARDGGTWGAWV